MKLGFTFAVLALAAFSGSARADGFSCQTADQSLNIKIFNHTDPAIGTRTGALMVLSDPAVSGGRKTIARFTDANGVFASRGASYEAKVDLRFNDSNRKGELLLGTKLGFVNTIAVDVDFNYSQPVNAGELLDGRLLLTKRNGDAESFALSCERYLKGE